MLTLYEELTTGPLAAEIAPYITAGDDAAIYNILHRKDIDSYSWVSVAKFEAWCAYNAAEYAVIEAHAGNAASPLYSAAKAMLRRLLSPPTDLAFNLSDPVIAGLFNAWPFADTTGATKAALMEAGKVKISRTEQLSIAASIADIATALRG